VLDALPRHVGDVQQAVDAAQVDERTVIGEVLDRATHDRAFLQVVHERAALSGELLLDDRAARDHDVVALLIELDDLELERLVFEVGGVANRPHVDQRARQERADMLDFDRETTLHATGDDSGDDFTLRESVFEARPGAGTLGLVARQSRFAGAVFDGVESDLDHLADLNFDLATLILELLDRNDGFGFESDVDDDHVGADIDHETREDLAGTDTLAGQTLFEQLRKTFSHFRLLVRCKGHRACCPDCHVPWTHGG